MSSSRLHRSVAALVALLVAVGLCVALDRAGGDREAASAAVSLPLPLPVVSKPPPR